MIWWSVALLQLYCPAFELVQQMEEYQKDYRKYTSNIEESCRASARYYVALGQLYARIVDNISHGVSNRQDTEFDWSNIVHIQSPLHLWPTKLQFFARNECLNKIKFFQSREGPLGGADLRLCSRQPDTSRYRASDRVVCPFTPPADLIDWLIDWPALAEFSPCFRAISPV